MNYDKAHQLAADIRQSDEYKRFAAAKERLGKDSPAMGLLKEYRRLELRAQAAAVAGGDDPETMERLSKLGELLRYDKDASEYLIAEYMLSRALGDIYRILAEAADMYLGALADR